MSKRLRHRGPDWSGVYSSDKAILVHERLAIVDPGNGAQPLYNPERTHVLAVNGEIYNHKGWRRTSRSTSSFRPTPTARCCWPSTRRRAPPSWMI